MSAETTPPAAMLAAPTLGRSGGACRGEVTRALPAGINCIRYRILPDELTCVVAADRLS